MEFIPEILVISAENIEAKRPVADWGYTPKYEKICPYCSIT